MEIRNLASRRHAALIEGYHSDGSLSDGNEQTELGIKGRAAGLK